MDKLATLFISTYNLPIHVPHDNINGRGTIFPDKIKDSSIKYKAVLRMRLYSLADFT